MTKNNTARISRVWILLLFTFAQPTHAADILNDILGVATTGSNRALAARDAARDARNNAADARDNAAEIRDNMRTGVIAVSIQMQQLIDDTLMDAQTLVDMYTAGRDAFVADGGCSVALCEPFRMDLVTLLQNFETTFNMVLGIADMSDFDVNFGRQIDLINNAPGRLLFPLYVVVTERNTLQAGLNQTLADLNIALDALSGILAQAPPLLNPTTILSAELDGCSAILTNVLTGQVDSGGPEQARAAADVVKLSAFGLKIVSKTLLGMGEVGNSEFDFGIHGYVHVTLKNDWVKSIGGTIDGLADVLLKVPVLVKTKINRCVSVHIQSQLLLAIQAIQCPRNVVPRGLNDFTQPAQPVTH